MHSNKTENWLKLYDNIVGNNNIKIGVLCGCKTEIHCNLSLYIQMLPSNALLLLCLVHPQIWYL